jgi:hypothetical protein
MTSPAVPVGLPSFRMCPVARSLPRLRRPSKRKFEIRWAPTVNLNANLDSTIDFVWVQPTYTFAMPVLGGQAAVSLGTFVGRNSTSLNGTLTASVPPFNLVRSDSISDSVTGFGDLYPQVTLKWNQGVNNFMVYVTGDIPVGAYDSTRLSNLGIGHGAIDGGAGYTYFDPKTGHFCGDRTYL